MFGSLLGGFGRGLTGFLGSGVGGAVGPFAGQRGAGPAMFGGNPFIAQLLARAMATPGTPSQQANPAVKGKKKRRGPLGFGAPVLPVGPPTGTY